MHWNLWTTELLFSNAELSAVPVKEMKIRLTKHDGRLMLMYIEICIFSGLIIEIT
jgi:hypothetical protein